tara:strand:+ start:16363 stop:16890 length:528 start_codon:yes stop_codon:yes gene_type:complete
MSKNDNDFGLKKIDLNEYKIKNNYSSHLLILGILILSGYLFYDKFYSSEKTKVITKDSSESKLDIDDITIQTDSQTYITNFSPEVEVKETGKINEVSYRSGKYYIIAGSFSNYNLSLNKANDLVENGFNAIIISPINQNNMYRVAVNTYDEINNAKKNLSLYKEKLNNELWILKH